MDRGIVAPWGALAKGLLGLAVLAADPAYGFHDSDWKCTTGGKPAVVCLQPSKQPFTLRAWDLSKGNCHDARPLFNGPLVCKDEKGVTVWDGTIKNGLYEGVVKEPRGPDEAKHTTYKAGIQNGPYRVYKKGKLAEEEIYVNGERKGTVKTWHENGKLKRAWNEKSSIDYAESGQLTGIRCDQPVAIPEMTRLCGYDGKPSMVKLTDGGGKVKETRTYVLRETTYRLGERNGPFKTYHPNGKVEELGQYAADELDGQWSKYAADGTLLERGTYVAGVREGKYEVHSANGKIAQLMTYAGGALDGRYATYYESGKKKTELPYGDGQLDGKASFWYENGKVLCHVTYAVGKRHGPMSCFYKTGKKQTEVTYDKGRLKKGKFYDPDGKVVT